MVRDSPRDWTADSASFVAHSDWTCPRGRALGSVDTPEALALTAVADSTVVMHRKSRLGGQQSSSPRATARVSRQDANRRESVSVPDLQGRPASSACSVEAMASSSYVHSVRDARTPVAPHVKDQSDSPIPRTDVPRSNQSRVCISRYVLRVDYMIYMNSAKLLLILIYSV